MPVASLPFTPDVSPQTLTAATVWREYEFQCKPGNVSRRPCVITPYHYRLDWAIWFAAMAEPRYYPWTLHFVYKLLQNDTAVIRFVVFFFPPSLGNARLTGDQPPSPQSFPRETTHIHTSSSLPVLLTLAQLSRCPYWYRYQFAPEGSADWWTRSYIREWLPPLRLNDPNLLRALSMYGWK